MRRALLACLLVGCASPNSPAPKAATLPTLQVQRADGRATSLPFELNGSVAVVDLWATWCTACERERPKLARLEAAYRPQGLRVIGLNVGEAPAAVSAYLAQNRIPYAIYFDPDFHVADALGDHQLPTLLVVDRTGRIVHRSASLDGATLAHVKSLLAAAPPP